MSIQQEKNVSYDVSHKHLNVSCAEMTN